MPVPVATLLQTSTNDAVGVALFGVIGLVLAVATVNTYRRVWRLRRTGYSRAAEVTEGRVKLRGRIDPGSTVTPPLSDEAAAVVDWEYQIPGRKTRWGTAASGRRAVTFTLVDGPGEVQVDPADASLEVSEENTTTAFFPPGEGVDELRRLADEIDGDRSGAGGGVHVAVEGDPPGPAHAIEDSTTRWRLVRRSLAPDDEVFLFGTARRVGGEVVVGGAGDELILSDHSDVDLVSKLHRKVLMLLIPTAFFLGGALYIWL